MLRSSSSNIVSHRFVARFVHEESSLLLILPYQHTELLGVVAHLFKVELTCKVGEERTQVLLDSVLFALP